MTSAITCDHPTFQEIERQIRSAIENVKRTERSTRHDRTQWRQLLTRAKKLIANFSKKAKESIAEIIKEFESLLDNLSGHRKQSREIRRRPCIAR